MDHPRHHIALRRVRTKPVLAIGRQRRSPGTLDSRIKGIRNNRPNRPALLKALGRKCTRINLTDNSLRVVKAVL